MSVPRDQSGSVMHILQGETSKEAAPLPVEALI